MNQDNSHTNREPASSLQRQAEQVLEWGDGIDPP